jgi:hypothetical protein
MWQGLPRGAEVGGRVAGLTRRRGVAEKDTDKNLGERQNLRARSQRRFVGLRSVAVVLWRMSFEECPLEMRRPAEAFHLL